MNFKDYLKENAKKIEETLEAELADFYKETKKTNSKLLPFAKNFINSCDGGKKIRGVLVRLGYELAQSVIMNEVKDLPVPDNVFTTEDSSSKTPRNDIFRVAAAFEILHTSLLIHDDIIDRSPKRRGKASLYMALGGNHYGQSQAISLGDIGLYLPIKIISETSFSAEVKIKAINYFSQMLINTGWGQIMDVEQDKDKNFINLYKTAKYTIAGPLQLGAILAGAKKELIRKLGDFGENLGIAFQIQDDILDGEVTSNDAYTQALEYALKAKKIMPEITKRRKIVRILEELVEYLVERSK